MITDALATFLSNTALNTGGAGTYVVGDVYPLGAAHQLHDVGDIYIVGQVSTTATSGGAAVLKLELVTADNAALTSNAKVIATSPEIAVADLVAGKRVFAQSLPLGSESQAYLGIRQVTGTAAFTAGALDVFLTQTPSNYRAFADGAN